MSRRAVLVWPVLASTNGGGRRALPTLIAEAIADVPATCARLGLEPLGEPSRWAIVPGEAMPGMEAHAEVLRCEIEAEQVPVHKREGYTWRAAG